MDVDSGERLTLTSGTPELQWSHVLMDVDSSEKISKRLFGAPASMEPRPDGRG